MTEDIPTINVRVSGSVIYKAVKQWIVTNEDLIKDKVAAGIFEYVRYSHIVFSSSQLRDIINKNIEKIIEEYFKNNESINEKIEKIVENRVNARIRKMLKDVR